LRRFIRISTPTAGRRARGITTYIGPASLEAK
jgi:hypothetical protein